MLKPGFGKLATLGELFEILYAHLPSLESETVSLQDALQRVSADSVSAEIDVPHFTKAAMDGYAVRAEDTFGATGANEKVLVITGSLTPGQVPTKPVEPGTCVEIGTGAPLPDGADGVVMVEYTEIEAKDKVRIRKGISPRENIVEIGSDVAAGETVLEPGVALQPRHLGVLAAIGVFEVDVVRKPRVALFSTGPEIIEPGGSLEPGRIYDINSHTLRAGLIGDGAEPVDLGIVADEPRALAEAIAEGLQRADLAMLSGGSSLGGGDLVTEAFEAAGKLLIHGVAVKPGKPVVVGTAVADGVEKLMIGLPGYPMSALSDYYIFIRPYLRRALGLETQPSFVEKTISRKHPSTTGRYEFLPVTLEGDQAIPLTKGSSSISALAAADGFVEIDENVEVVEAGEQVKVRLF